MWVFKYHQFWLANWLVFDLSPGIKKNEATVLTINASAFQIQIVNFFSDVWVQVKPKNSYWAWGKNIAQKYEGKKPKYSIFQMFIVFHILFFFINIPLLSVMITKYNFDILSMLGSILFVFKREMIWFKNLFLLLIILLNWISLFFSPKSRNQHSNVLDIIW